MADLPLRLAVIVGSVREGRFGDTVARWIAGRAHDRTPAHGAFAVDLVDLADANLPLVQGRVRTPAASAFATRIAAADGFVVVTPEYNHAYPAALKLALDTLEDEWRHKPVGFVCYGGRSGGLRAVEQLRTVFVRLDAITVREIVSFQGARRAFDPGCEPLDRAGCRRRGSRDARPPRLVGGVAAPRAPGGSGRVGSGARPRRGPGFTGPHLTRAGSTTSIDRQSIGSNRA